MVAKLLRMMSFATGRTALANPARPRSRGEHQFFATECPASRGASPLARGPPSKANHHVSRDGLIPARAGTTRCQPSYAHRWWAHPRSRGDHTPGRPLELVHSGSSPLARGPPTWVCRIVFAVGLILARAGTTSTTTTSPARTWAHPRSRGDHEYDHDFSRQNVGSSPLARGPQDPYSPVLESTGLIPARAGTTSLSSK